VHHAPCAVAVAPRGYRDDPRPVERIGVAFDGTRESGAALDAAAAHAHAAGARIHVRLVAEIPATLMPPHVSPFAWTKLEEELVQAGERQLAGALSRLEVPHDGEVVAGPVKQSLVALSREVDVLVCGSGGWGAVHRVMLGSTSDYLLHHAACPVIVVPRPGEAGAEDGTRRVTAENHG